MKLDSMRRLTTIGGLCRNRNMKHIQNMLIYRFMCILEECTALRSSLFTYVRFLYLEGLIYVTDYLNGLMKDFVKKYFNRMFDTTKIFQKELTCQQSV